jgi:hypothetical protein
VSINIKDEFVAPKSDKDYEPVLKSKGLFSMEPGGVYGSVFESPNSVVTTRRTLFACVIAGVIVLAILISMGVNSNNAGDTSSEAVRELSTPVERNIPVLSDLYGKGNTQIRRTLEASNTIYQVSSDSDSMSLVRIPDDVSAEEMALYYSNGLDSLSTDQLATLLRGAWFFSIDTSGAQVMKVKYADFTSGTTDKAISNAMEQQGINDKSPQIISEGTDSNRNTYKYGTIVVNNETLYWRVACCQLSSVYENTGLPKNALYVGITLSDGELITSASQS